MRHVKALGIKLLITATVIYSLLSIFETASLTEMFVISLLVTGIAYVIGDLYLLPKFGNFRATIADFGLSFVSIWLLSTFFIDAAFPVITISLFASFFLAITEALFHAYMLEKVIKTEDANRKKDVLPNFRYQTETSEENHPDYIKKK
ncbi:YndM family protein [Oceanobacillus bengalensis]|uniref:DUF2512 family protein n=1 Tax=Oceanobacillus bengalensis TaxID=1435466 RepID=A0A494YWF6_9BACI|nr:YndM family protein [Oceanobacillus bengalensis]RKQ14547.1 DUF2512 family protein [Oceanobacillus bengalensis]